MGRSRSYRSLNVPPRILIVDDDIRVAAALRRILRDYTLELCYSGAEAVERCLEGDYDLVLCDMMMPGLSGMDVYLRLTELRPEIIPRIVFVTGGTFTPGITAFMDRISNLVVEKPVSRPLLLQIVAQLTGGSLDK